jgi:serine/threonine-protein kinase
MAVVELAEDTLLGRQVALKRMTVTEDARGGLRLHREALMGASVSHANLVSVYDVVTGVDGNLVIVMEYVEGENLAERLDRHGRLAPAKALSIIQGVAGGLDAIHKQGIVHRDVKPPNILLGSRDTVKLADLGVASAPDHTRLTSSGAIVGSLRYMAPEQVENLESTKAIDVYALAAVTFEALSGTRARREANPLALAHAIATKPPPDLREAWPDAPADAAELLTRAMSRDPRKRPDSAGEFAGRLSEILDPQPTARIPIPVDPVPAPTAVSQPDPTPPGQQPAIHPRRSPAATPVRSASAAPRTPRTPTRPDREPRRPVASPPRPGRPPERFGNSGRPRGTPAAAAGLEADSPRVPTGGQRGRPWRPLGAAGALVALAAAVIVVVVLSTSGGAGNHRAASPPLTRAHSATGSTTASTAGSGSTSASNPSSAAGAAGNPVNAVESFYKLAAAHNFPAAWALADPAFRTQLAGYQSFQAGQQPVKSVSFDSARVVSQSGDSATVALSTTSTHTDGAHHCSGTADLNRAGASGSWLLHQIHINCT